MNIRSLKYLLPLTLYALAFAAFSNKGWLTFAPVIYAWVLLPLAELFIQPAGKNLDAAEAELARSDRLYDYLLYFFVLLQFVALFYFLSSMKNDSLNWWETLGRITAMGLLCGTFGINIGHELGHRVNAFEQRLAKASLLSSMYMHFFIEHNRGHHKHVATPSDPSSARYNEPLYGFYFRTIVFSYLSAWKIANSAMRKKGLPLLHPANEMLQAHLVQLIFLVLILLVFGPLVTVYYLCSATIGIALLETVNYIEHYGLQRKPTGNGNYERAMPHHSWNSNHIIGRLMLFELSRHSDHHYLASKKYQLLDHHPNVPQLPTGYPGSMLLALLPPAWFYVMNKRIAGIRSENVAASNGGPD